MKVIKYFLTIFSIFCLFTMPGCNESNKRKVPQPTIKATTTLKQNLEDFSSGNETTSYKQSESNQKSTDKSKQTTIKNVPTITVWVHGSRLITQFAPQEFLYSPSGVKAIKDVPKYYHMYKIAKNLSLIDPQRFQVDNFYVFGWSGRVSFEARKKAAADLYDALNTLSKEYYEKTGLWPTFRIITHSHGGNVALNLAYIKDNERLFTISELILLACPVQEKTKKAIENPLFERIYSLFSRGELLQVLDPQGLYKENRNAPLFSQRIFPYKPKISQAEIKIYGRSILHIEFLLSYFVYKLPAILNALDKEHRMQSKNAQEHDYVIIDLKKKQKRKKNRHRKHKILII